MIAQVIVDIKAYSVDKVFDYVIPDHLDITVGMRVKAPFGARTIDGYVIKITDEPTDPTRQLKALLSVSDIQFLNEELIELAAVFAQKTASFQTSMLQAMLPKDVTKRKMKTVEVITELIKTEVSAKAKKQQAVLSYLLEAKLPVALPDLRKRFGASVVAKLMQDGYFRIETIEAAVGAQADQSFAHAREVTLRAEQEAVLSALRTDDMRPILLKGITGSGKTEIFLTYVEELLELGKTALVLVPEIGLTPQIIQRFEKRFGSSKLAVLHSKLSQAARFEMWRKIKEQQVSIVLGTRSAIFAPLENIGVIIIDEEHDMSYKQENMPTYNAKEVAMWRSVYHGAKTLLASATPSLESYIRAQKGLYQLLELNERVIEHAHNIHLINMRDYIAEPEYRYFSPELLQAMQNALAADEQIILLLNRRGYAPFVQCHQCGYTPTCQHCDTNLVYHKEQQKFICHYCQYMEVAAKTCPECLAPLEMSGIGVQKIAEELMKLFPEATLLQADRDHIKTLSDYQEVYQAFNKREAQILLGTQMVAKGFDFPNVTVVGVLETDQILHMPDLRAREKAFQLLTQVIGRAGRGTKQGAAFLQTYEPENELFADILHGDYDAFAQKELTMRQQFQSPPFWHMSDIIISATDLNAAARCANAMYDLMQPLQQFATVYAPAPTFIKKVNNRYHLHILLKYKDSSIVVKNVKTVIEHTTKAYPEVRAYLQVNPLTFN